MIKGTEPEHLDIIVELDAESQEEFAMNYDSGERGALDILYDANNYMLVRGSYKYMKQQLEQDYRFRKLSDDGKKAALSRLQRESKEKDAELVNSWIDRLQAALNAKNKKSKYNKNDFNSIFDGLK